MTEQVYLAYVVGTPAPAFVLRWEMAEKFGWTLEYIANLKVSDIHEYLIIQSVKEKAKTSLLRK